MLPSLIVLRDDDRKRYSQKSNATQEELEKVWRYMQSGGVDNVYNTNTADTANPAYAADTA